MTMRPLDPRTFTNPRMREVAYWHILILRTDMLSARTGFGLADVWSFIKSENYKLAEARLFEHARQLRGINVMDKRGEDDSVSEMRAADPLDNSRSKRLCSSCSRDLNRDPSNPKSPETRVNVGEETQ